MPLRIFPSSRDTQSSFPSNGKADFLHLKNNMDPFLTTKYLLGIFLEWDWRQRLTVVKFVYLICFNKGLEAFQDILWQVTQSIACES